MDSTPQSVTLEDPIASPNELVLSRSEDADSAIQPLHPTLGRWEHFGRKVNGTIALCTVVRICPILTDNHSARSPLLYQRGNSEHRCLLTPIDLITELKDFGFVCRTRRNLRLPS